MITLGLAGYNLVSLGLLVTGVIVPRARITKKNVAVLFKQYAFENKRRFGSMIVHFGVIIIALGVVGSGAYRVDEQFRIDFGQSYTFQGYELKAIDKFMEQTPGKVSAGAIIEMYKNGKLITTKRPRINVFPGQQMSVPTPAVIYLPWHDVYLNIVGTLSPDQSYVSLRAIQSPLVTWIWLGGLIMALGTAYALSPNGRKVQESREIEKAG